MNKWQLLRQYDRLADDGLVKPLLHDCGHELVSILGDNDDEPGFYCAMDNILIAPGEAFWHDLQKKVDDNDLAGP